MLKWIFEVSVLQDEYPYQISYQNPVNKSSFDQITRCYEQRIKKQNMSLIKTFQKVLETPCIQLISIYNTLEETAFAIIAKRELRKYHQIIEVYHNEKRKQYLIDVFDPIEKMFAISILKPNGKLWYYFNTLKLYPIVKSTEIRLTSDKFKEQVYGQLQKIKKKNNKVLSIGRNIQPKMMSIYGDSISRQHLQLSYTSEFLLFQKIVQNFLMCWCSARRSSPLCRLTKEMFYKIVSYLVPEFKFEISDTNSTFGTEILLKQPEEIDTQEEYCLQQQNIPIKFFKIAKQQYEIDLLNDEKPDPKMDQILLLKVIINQRTQLKRQSNNPPIGIIYVQRDKKLYPTDLNNPLIDFIIYFENGKWMLKPVNCCKIWKKLIKDQKYYFNKETTFRLSQNTQMTIYPSKKHWLFNE